MAQENTNATEGYQMKTGWGTIAMLISATGMGPRCPWFSRWATRTDMFDGAMGLRPATPSALSWPAAAWAWACCSSSS